jgi:hypothetical protein
MTAAADVLGRAPEQLTLSERAALAGLTVALELYSPESLPERRIQAIGDSAAECIRQLAAKGLDPRKFEFLVLKAL